VFVHTSHGRGRIVDEQSVRGRKSFLVEGSGFKVWLDEKDLRIANEVNHDNSTHLPYDPTPQHPTDMFSSESTIQPTYEIDADERLHDADSLSFDEVTNRSYPAPSADNFARHAAGGHASGEEFAPPSGYRGKHRPLPAPDQYGAWDSQDWLDANPAPRFPDPRDQSAYEQHLNRVHGFGRELGDRNLHPFDPMYSEAQYPELGQRGTIPVADILNRMGAFDRHAAGMQDFADAAEEAVDAAEDKPSPKAKPSWAHPIQRAKQDAENLIDDFAGDQNKKQVGGYWPGRPDGQTVTSSLYERPAGLSDKYIRVEAHVDHYSDPVQQFRDDPVGFIQKRAYAHQGSADIRLAEYVDLVDSDHGIRTAAWKDVRAKALRLRREGKVHVKDISPTRIYAYVDGDTDTYETMVVKSSANQSIDSWTCNCGWGSTVGQRKVSYVGRLCSHGYAAFLEMESQQMKANNKRRKSASIVEDFKQWADNENSGKVDQNAIDNFIYFLNSQEDGDRTVVSEEDAEKLYDALDGMKANGKVRNYDVGYDQQPDSHYKEADVLHLRPTSLTPDYTHIEDGDDGQFWTDVTKDERKTTGPDNMVKKSSRLTGRELHYASDDELFDAVKDWAGASSKLEKLRNLSAEEPDYGNRRNQNYEIREVVDELHDRGIDASQFVASLRFAEDASADAAAEDDDEKKKAQPASTQNQPDMSGTSSDTGQPGGSSSITKPEAGQNSSGAAPVPSASAPSTPTTPSTGGTGDLSGQSSDPSSVGFGGYRNQNGNQDQGSSSFDPASMMGMGGGSGGGGIGVEDVMNFLPEVFSTVGQIGQGIGNGISGIVNGLSGLGGLLHRSSNEHIATPIGGFPNVQLTNQESFQGSGPNPKYWMGSSECYVDDHERDRFVDLTDLDDDPIIKYTGEKPKQGPKRTSRSRHPFDRYAADEDEVRNDLLQAEGEEIESLGLYSQFLDDAEEAGDDQAADVIDEALSDEKDHARNFGELIKHFSSENANPETSTLTSGSGMNDSGVSTGFEQVFKAGANGNAWDGHRVRDFRRYVSQHGRGRPDHLVLQEYLAKPHRSLDQGGIQHLQNYTSDAEQHQASLNTDDRSDIVAQFHRMGGIEAINNSGGSGGGSYSDSSIAERAQGFLRTAGRNYSLAEQRELEEEAHPKGARNLSDLDLRGTHYEDAL
jgi:hypothetical protein